MEIKVVNFNSLSLEEKIQLLQKNQNLLLKYHPDSEFVIREYQDKNGRIYKHYIDLIKKYQGKVVYGENFMLFFHIMKINNQDDTSEYARKRAEGEFSDDGNCLFAEYMVGKYSAKDLASLEEYFKDKKVEFISYVRHERINSVSFAKYKQRILKNASA